MQFFNLFAVFQRKKSDLAKQSISKGIKQLQTGTDYDINKV